MKKINIDFENCYGIGKLEHNFDFSKTNTFLVYAPNGVMKTSLAKTIRYFANADDKAPCDQLYPERIPKFELKFDNDLITQGEQRILIVDPEIENYDASHKISNFIASKELKGEFDKIYEELDQQKTEFIKKLKSVSKSSDCESEIISAFSKEGEENFFDILNDIAPLLENDFEKFDFKYNDIFDKKGNILKFLEKHKSDLDAYVQNYESLISKSSLFKKSDNSFGTYKASVVLKSIEDDSFFEAGHSLELQGDVKVTSADTLKSLLEGEIGKIISDPDLKKIFDKVDKAIGSNVELRAFQNAIEKNNLLLVELKDYEEFKKKVWLGYLSEIKSNALDLHVFYLTKKKDLDVLLEKAKEEQETWKTLIDQFNARFHVPFKVELANQEDVILKKERAALNFLYSDREGESPIEQEKDTLFNNVLSRGERRALYILQILFDIESKKLSPDTVLIVFDDIADSFDYKNKYAIIEYIKDLDELGKFRLILLTHNFDFYRTVASRLDMRKKYSLSVLMTTKQDDGTVVLKRGEYVNDIFNHFLGRFSEKRIFISLIPFLRNIIAYTEGSDSSEYETLTKCLHKKNDTDQVLVSNILDIWSQRFQKYKTTFQGIDFDSQKVIELIYEVADQIAVEEISNEILLENKIVLSIAVRLKAEEFMIANIAGLNLDDITSSQTQELIKLYKVEASADADKVKILNKVALMTPENIHLNAFMYEPLIDISLYHLVDLYNETKDL